MKPASLLVVVGLVLAVSTAGAADAPTDIAPYVKDFFEKIRNGDIQGIQQKFITTHTIVRCYTVLPFGGLYQGNQEIDTLHARFTRFIDVKTWSYNITFTNNYNGYAMAVLTAKGVRAGQTAQVAGQDPNLVLTFNVLLDFHANGKLKRAAWILIDDLLVANKIKTLAEQRLHELGSKMMAMKSGSVSAENLRELIADDVRLTLVNFGGVKLLPKTSFQGIGEIVQGLQAFKKMFMESDCVRSSQYSLCNSKLKVLKSDDTTVIFKLVVDTDLFLPRFVVGHVVFNPQGKLLSVVLTSSVAVHPWQMMIPSHRSENGTESEN